MFAAALFLAAVQTASAAPVTLAVNPRPVCRDRSFTTYPNFDLLITNHGSTDVHVREMRGLVTDSLGRLIERRILWQQALSLLGKAAVIEPGDTSIVFNPFSFRHLGPQQALRYELDVSGMSAPISVDVPLTDCAPKHLFHLPIAARLLVYDGHDFLSHHRRGLYRPVEAASRENFQRFGLDLVVIDERGRMFAGNGKTNSDWFGWGKPVRAAAAGIVTALHDGQPDNLVVGTLDQFHPDADPTNDMASYGNYVLIDHGGGEFSVVGHLQNGSVKVRIGQRVSTGALLGRVGNSGASGGIHTHFERRTGPGTSNMHSLPPYFSAFHFAGGRRGAPDGTIIDTGDVVISDR